MTTPDHATARDECGDCSTVIFWTSWPGQECRWETSDGSIWCHGRSGRRPAFEQGHAPYGHRPVIARQPEGTVCRCYGAAGLHIHRTEPAPRSTTPGQKVTCPQETVLRDYTELLSSIYLYINWRYVTKQLTTPQKELWADAVDSTREPGGEYRVHRWWHT